MTRGCEGEVLGIVIFAVIVGFVVSVVSTDTVVAEVLGPVGSVLVVELLVTLGCTVVTKRKKKKEKIRISPQ